jgi:hypothetical protein
MLTGGVLLIIFANSLTALAAVAGYKSLLDFCRSQCREIDQTTSDAATTMQAASHCRETLQKVAQTP